MKDRFAIKDVGLRSSQAKSCPGWQLRRLGLDKAATVLGLAFLLFITGCEKKEEAPPPAPPEVEVTDVVEQNVPIYQDWVAQLNGPVNADITPKVQGYLLKRDYSEGFFVKKGQLLYEIDPRPFDAALDQAKAQVAVSAAQQGEAESQPPAIPHWQHSTPYLRNSWIRTSRTSKPPRPRYWPTRLTSVKPS